jgi:Double zinc ribbon
LICQSCGHENPAPNRFCGDCGVALANLCPKCGADNPAGKRYCGDCGAELSINARHSCGLSAQTEARGSRRHPHRLGRRRPGGRKGCRRIRRCAQYFLARVQGVADPDTVIMTAAVHDLVSGLFAVEDRGTRQLKGIEQPVQLYRAISSGLASGRGFSTRELMPFVGREDELRLLSSRWERVPGGVRASWCW